MFAYDHTISAPAERGENIKFFKTGLGIGEHLKTLRNLINQNHHEASSIDYLKVNWELLKNYLIIWCLSSGQIDIEGYEFSEGGFKDWISSGALENVSQIALELHIPDIPDDER